MMRRFRLLLFTAMVFFATQPLRADIVQDAETFFKTRLNEVIDLLRMKDVDREVKKQKVTDTILPVFDFELMAKLSLGKQHWSGLTGAQKNRFNELFIRKLKDSYLDKMLMYTDEKIVYKTTELQGNKVQIPTELISKDSVYAMIYKLYPTGGEWKIYDIEIEGVSIIKSYRTQFDSVLNTGSVDDLFKKMEQPEENK
jgi:phospholipid transport system substrate-binding protein